ncbi:hypothetical protein ACOMHN_033529 [Nucella lapillus]
MSVNTNDSPRGLWYDDYEQQVLEILRRPLTGKKEDWEVYHIKNSFAVVSIAGLDRIQRKSSGKLTQTRLTSQDMSDKLTQTRLTSQDMSDKLTQTRLTSQYMLDRLTD